MRAFAIRNVGWWGYDGYVSLYELFVAFGHLSINTKVNLKKNKKQKPILNIHSGLCKLLTKIQIITSSVNIMSAWTYNASSFHECGSSRVLWHITYCNMLYLQTTHIVILLSFIDLGTSKLPHIREHIKSSFLFGNMVSPKAWQWTISYKHT